MLVVDDDDSIRKVFKLILEAQGYEVETVETGLQALKMVQERFYSLVTIDIRLPDMEGTKLLRELHRSSPKSMKIMVTGYPSLENAVNSLNIGADAYIIKPVEPDELINTVKAKLKEQEGMESLSQEKIDNWISTRIQKLEEKYGIH
ncbi:response regulator [Candidatus Bathyarchaeota archaeon]|nr:response regulator [Candidatus Bathyarchaeota archaeon]